MQVHWAPSVEGCPGQLPLEVQVRGLPLASQLTLSSGAGAAAERDLLPQTQGQLWEGGREASRFRGCASPAPSWSPSQVTAIVPLRHLAVLSSMPAGNPGFWPALGSCLKPHRHTVTCTHKGRITAQRHPCPLAQLQDTDAHGCHRAMKTKTCTQFPSTHTHCHSNPLAPAGPSAPPPSPGFSQVD